MNHAKVGAATFRGINQVTSRMPVTILYAIQVCNF